MMTAPPTQPPASTPPADRVDVRQPVDPALRRAFEEALARRPKLSRDDEQAPQCQPASEPLFHPQPLTQPQSPPLPPALPQPQSQPQSQPVGGSLPEPSAPAQRARRVEPESPVFLSSQPVPGLPPLATAESPGAGAQPTDARPTPAMLGAALTALAMPVSADGVQHWQFSFSQPGSALSGVAFTAAPDAPWQLQLQLPAHARERSALDARLGELRQRLASRGALVGDIDLHDPVEGHGAR